MEIYYSIQLLFCLITTFLYILVLICLFQGWRSRGSGINIPFAKICFVTGICDILTFVSNNIFNISPKACLFSEFYKSFEDLFVHIYLFFAWGGGASEGLCVLVIAFNRLSIVISPELSKKYWNSKWIYLIFGFQIIPGILIGCTTLMFEVKWKQTINHCALLAVFIEDSVPRLYFKIAAIFLSFISVLLIIIYSVILVYLKKAHKLQLNISHRSCNQILYRQIIRESRLLTISSIICAVQIIYVGYIALREFTGFDRSYIGASIMGDISAGINPYLLLIFSPIIRKRAFKLLN